AGTDAGVLGASLQRTLAALAPDTPVFAVRTLAEVTAETLALRRFNMSLMSAFAATALALAAVGLYGLIAWSTGQRRREIGVRQSLGANAADIWRLVLGDGLRLVLPGLVLGIAGALALARLLAAQLYGVGAADPGIIALSGAVLVLVALLACAVPTLRAARVPPATALQ
ncbi:MAG: FtsX-like permease family protein, partial [Lysobacterales bacterium]